MGELFMKLLNMSITASWLILVVLLIRILFKKMPRWIICLLWGMVAIRLICPFSIESAISMIPSNEYVKSSTSVYGEVHDYIPSIDSDSAVIRSTINPILQDSFAYEEYESVAPLQIVTYIGGIIWLCGLFFILCYAFVSRWKIYRLVEEAVCYNQNVYLCDAVTSPFVLGMIRPKIYLPSGLEQEKINYILAHEAAHLKRKDLWWKPIAYLLLAIYWFQPLCWIAYFMFCWDIELACDEKVIKELSFDQKKEYSRVLLECGQQKKMILSCPLAFGEGRIKERVKAVLDYKRPAFWVIVLTMVVCGVIAVLFLTNPEDETHRAYHLKELDEYFEGTSYEYSLWEDVYESKTLTMEEVNDRFPIEDMEICKYDDDNVLTAYTVYPVKEGGCYYVFWSTTREDGIRKVGPDSIVQFTAYIATPTRDASLFESIKSGVSTARDVKAVDPYSYMEFSKSSGTVSLSYLDRDNVLEVQYDNESLQYIIPDYKDMIVQSVKVRPRYRLFPYGYIKEEDLPKGKTENVKYLIDESEIIHTYFETLIEDWERQQEKGEPVYYITHYELSDGTWATKERSYKYRLELSGILENTNDDFMFIILTNKNDITFEQVYDQWRLDISNDEFFHPDDTIIVGIRT